LSSEKYTDGDLEFWFLSKTTGLSHSSGIYLFLPPKLKKSRVVPEIVSDWDNVCLASGTILVWAYVLAQITVSLNFHIFSFGTNQCTFLPIISWYC
jgi:hypothetical protein